MQPVEYLARSLPRPISSLVAVVAAAVAVIAVVAVAVAVPGCDRSAGPPGLPADPGPDGLAAHLSAAIAWAGSDLEKAEILIARWQLRPDELAATLTPGYDRLYPDYARAYRSAAAGLARQLVDLADRPIAARPQYADAPYLSPAQIRLRWALPVGNPGAVAFAGERRLPPVWVHTGTRWASLLGLDRAVDRTVAARAPCWDAVDRGCTAGRCLIEAFRVYDAALTGDAGAVAAACRSLARPAGPARGPGDRATGSSD